MNRFLLSFLLLFCARNSFAQEEISRKPVRPPEEIRTRLFDLPEGDSAVFIRVDLPGEEYFLLRMKNITAWKPKSLPDIVAVANHLYTEVSDSFKDATATRHLSIRIPPKGPMLMQLSESGGGKKVFSINGQNAGEIRVATDTLSILQTASGQNGADGVLYTFLLKDLSRIKVLSENAALIKQVSGMVDSLIENRRQRWKRPESRTHLLQAQYDVVSGENGQLTLGQRSTVGGNFHYSVGWGMSFLAGNFTSFIDYKLAYQWATKKPEKYRFVALSYSTNIFYKEENSSISGRLLQFLNAEIGTSFGRGKSGVPLYRGSAGFGYRVLSYNTGPYDFRYRYFVNYNVTPAIIITPDLYFTGRRPTTNDPNNISSIIGGITVTLRLF